MLTKLIGGIGYGHGFGTETEMACLDCGGKIEPGRAALGAVRCHGCWRPTA
jgi:hypothetical protein